MQPNFIVILIDDLRHDEFGAGGQPFRASLRRELRRLVADAAGI